MLIQSERAFRDITYSLSKELSFFDNTLKQMNNQASTVKQTQGVYKLDQSTNRAGVTLLLTLMIITTAGICASVLTAEKFPALRSWIIGLAVVAAVVALTVYLLDTSARVRTDAEKRYWGNPAFK